MMLYRREGLIPASRRVAALSIEEQHAQVTGLGFVRLKELGALAANTADPLLDIDKLTVRFGGLVALNAVSLAVPAHSVLAVIGPNGSGKSTLFNAVTGLVPAEGGKVNFAGAAI